MSGHCNLMIENGLQSGRSLTLPSGRHSIGSASDNKMVIADCEMAQAHFMLDASSKPVLIALEGDVTFENGRVLQPGDSRAVTLPLRFTAGNTRFFLAAASDDNASGRRLRLATPLALVAGVIGFLIFQGMFAKSSEALQPVSIASLNAFRAPPKSAAQVTEEAVVALKIRAMAAGLTELHITGDASNMIQIAGDVPAPQQPAWQAVRQWFDATYGTKFAVVDRINVSYPTVPLNVAAVRYGAQPFVVDQSGQKLFIGSQTSNGWTIDGINETRVTLHKDNQTAAVTF